MKPSILLIILWTCSFYSQFSYASNADSAEEKHDVMDFTEEDEHQIMEAASKAAIYLQIYKNKKHFEGYFESDDDTMPPSVRFFATKVASKYDTLKSAVFATHQPQRPKIIYDDLMQYILFSESDDETWSVDATYGHVDTSFKFEKLRTSSRCSILCFARALARVLDDQNLTKLDMLLKEELYPVAIFKSLERLDLIDQKLNQASLELKAKLQTDPNFNDHRPGEMSAGQITLIFGALAGVLWLTNGAKH